MKLPMSLPHSLSLPAPTKGNHYLKFSIYHPHACLFTFIIHIYAHRGSIVCMFLNFI